MGKLLTDISDMPKKARLRLKCFESVATEVKSVLSTIREKSDVTEVAYVRVDSPNSSSSNIIDNTNFNLSDVSDVDYQNKLITEYLQKTHRYYIEIKVPEIESLIEQMVKTCSAQKENMGLLKRFFSEPRSVLLDATADLLRVAVQKASVLQQIPQLLPDLFS